MEPGPTLITVIPPTPLPTTEASPAPPPTTVAETPPQPPPPPPSDADDRKVDGMLEWVADDKVELMSDWLRHHTDIFTHLSRGASIGRTRAPPVR